MKQVTARVVFNKKILPGGPHRSGYSLAGQLIRLHCPEIAKEAKPGQFVMVSCGELVLPRPFSIHQTDGEGIALFFAVLANGKGTKWLSQQKKGETIELFGPLGNGFLIQSRAKNLLLVAGGMGLAPLCFLAQQALTKKHSVTLLLGAAKGPLYTERPGNLLPQGVNVITATEDGSVGKKGRVTDLLSNFTGMADQVFACGPLPMYRDMALRKKELKLEGKSVQVSIEAGMGCGTGVCYGCTIKTKQGLKQVCNDGPVFDMDDISWDELMR